MRRSKIAALACLFVSPIAIVVPAGAVDTPETARTTREVVSFAQGDAVSFATIMDEAIQAERAIEFAGGELGNSTSATHHKTIGKTLALAGLMKEVRQLPAGMAVEDLTIYRAGNEVGFAPPGIEIQEFRTSRTVDGQGDLVSQQVGILQKQVPTEAAARALLPATRGFSSTARHADGRYSWRWGEVGGVRIHWQKDWIVETGDWHSDPDWMVYSAWTEAEAYDQPWYKSQFYIYDIDTVNGVTSGSDWAHIQDNGHEVYSAPDGCSSLEVGGSWGGFGMAIPLEQCSGTRVKGDRVGGKHVEFRNVKSFFTGRYVIRDRQFAAGYSQEVKTKSNGAMFWWDYGDACFSRDGSLIGCEEEVVQ